MRTYYFIQRHSIYGGYALRDRVQSKRPQEWRLGQVDRVYSLRASSIAEARRAVSCGVAVASVMFGLRREPGL